MLHNLSGNISLLFTLLISASLNVEAQSIVRSTFCGSGATFSSSSASLTSTFGQCPGCGTLSSNTSFLTQGFQQPSPNNCSFSAAIQFVETVDNCGTTYSFNYTGDADLNTVELNWDFGPNGFPQTSTLNNPQGVAFSATGIVMVTLRVIGGDCEKLASLEVDVPAMGFSANAISDHIDCFGDVDGSIEVEVLGGTAPFDYQWSTGEQSANIENLEAGDYGYTVTDANGCETTNIISITAPSEALNVNAQIQSEKCEGDLDGSIEVTVVGGTSPYSLQWDNGETASSLTDLPTGNYLLTVTDANGCTSEFGMAVGHMCELVVNDVLSPNGDSANDTWEVQGISQFPNNEVAIFNRWGQRVWRAKPYANDWAGTNESGETLPIGAYFYVLKLHDPEKQVLTGSVTLVR